MYQSFIIQDNYFQDPTWMKFTCTKCFFVININQIQEQKFAGIQFFSWKCTNTKYYLLFYNKMS